MVEDNYSQSQQLAICGSPQQVDKIWQHRKNWQLEISYDGDSLPYKLIKCQDKIIVLLKESLPPDHEEWWKNKLLACNFTATSRTANMVLSPLKNNGMKITINQLTLGKNKICIN